MAVSDLVYIDATGYNYEDYPAFLNYFTTSYQGIYGADTYLDPDSQDGQWIAIQAQAAYDAAELGAATYNSFSPATAQGVGLSRNVKINGLERITPTNSTVDVTIGGTAGTVLTNAVAIDTLQQQWNIPSPTTIPSGGTITVTATAAVEGAIQAAPNTVTGIFTPTQGWQTITNADAATPGTPVESDAALRVRQAQSTALPAQTVFDATIGAVENVAGVVATQGYENPTNSTDGNGLPPHSISIVVSGGDDTAVAQAIQVKKTPGTQTYGTTSVPLTDSHGMPITINFYRPTNATIGVQVTIATLAGWDTSYEAMIQDAVSAAVLAYSIGGDIIITQLYYAAYLYGTVAQGSFLISSIEISKNGGSLGTTNIQLDFNEIPVCDPSTDVSIVT